MPEYVKIDPRLAKNWMPEIELNVSDEKYFKG